MILAKKQLDLFCEYLKTQYGATVCIRSDVERQKLGEYMRTVLGARLIVVRELESHNSEILEVFCSNREFLKSVEDTWNLLLLSITEDDQDGKDRV